MSEKDKPDGVLEGLGKSFLGLPYSGVLNTAEKGVVASVRGNELVRQQTSSLERHGDRAQQTAQRAFHELQGLRVAAQRGAASLDDTRHELVAANGSLSRIGDALESGLPEISSHLIELHATTRRVAGLPETSRSAAELLANGEVVESETIILALGGGLKAGQREQVLEGLAAWKRDLIDSGLVYGHDSEVERKLTPGEKVFLAELRRKADAPLSSFRSIGALQRHGSLDEDLGRALSKTVRDARYGMTGTIDAIHEVADHGRTGVEQRQAMIDLQRRGVSQGDTRISQADVLNRLQAASLLVGRASLDEQRGIHTGVSRLVDLERLASAERHAIRLASEATSANTGAIREHTLAIARGISAQLYLAQRAEQQLGGILDASEGTQRNTELLTVLASRANAVAEANFGANAATARNTALIAGGMDHIVDLGLASLEIGEATARSSADTAASAQALVGFARRSELAHALMIEQGESTLQLLGDVADGIDTGNYYQALTREAIEEAHITLIQGFADLKALGVAQNEEAFRTNGLLTALLEAQLTGVGRVLESIQKLDIGMERRHETENRARAGERFVEAMRNYRKGFIALAIEIFGLSLKEWSADYRVYFYRGICHVLSDRPALARADLQTALVWTDETELRVRATVQLNLARLEYSEAKLLLQRGDSAGNDEKLVEAITAARKAEEEDPTFPECSFAVATYLAAFKLFEEARTRLVELIRRAPHFVARMRFVPEFAPLLPAFQHVLNVSLPEHSGGESAEVTVAVLRDTIEVGDFDAAKRCLDELMATGASHFLSQEVWKLPELVPLRRSVIESARRALVLVGPRDTQQWYALAILGLCLRANPGEIPDLEIFGAFLKGAEHDVDVRAKNADAMLRKLSRLSPQGLASILVMNTRHRKGLAWLPAVAPASSPG